MKFKIYRQFDKMDCGPTCLQMIANFYGKFFSLNYLRELCNLTKEGVSLLDIKEASEKIGFRTTVAKISAEQLIESAELPCILFWGQNHYVILYEIPNRNQPKLIKHFFIADPNHGKAKLGSKSFLSKWLTDESNGIVLMLEPTAEFYSQEEKKTETSNYKFLLKYIIPYRSRIAQLLFFMLLGSLLNLAFPILAQSLVDTGISQRNIKFIYLILFSQLMLFLGGTMIDMLRSWILLHLNTRINLRLISDFLQKLMKLPMKFFDTKMNGDILQRISDHDRIERFLTISSINTVFSFLNLIFFSFIICSYSLKIFFVFVILSILSILWARIFLKQRKTLDYKRFTILGETQNVLQQLIIGMQEIKLNNSEQFKREEWETLQIRLLSINIKNLSVEQYQRIGYNFISQLKNILISFIAATEVINQHMTLGMMVSISYIIGQMNSPIDQLLTFLRLAQEANLSMQRLNEIHGKANEENEDYRNGGSNFINSVSNRFSEETTTKGITLKNLSFRYGGVNSPYILKDINLFIPFGKITAVVGSSGSGKTTLLKLLLKFYEPTKGAILINSNNFNTISPFLWRSKSGAVMQDGYIFSDTIEKNIAMGQYIDKLKIQNAAKVANIHDYIEGLPLSYGTKLGMTGNGLSTGQKQRILIARAIYRNPSFIFFDEATSALDANNEKVIIENLNRFFEGRTVFIVAHRLSTVKNADKILVLDRGNIVEFGNHNTLVKNRGAYYELIKNQLELGN